MTNQTSAAPRGHVAVLQSMAKHGWVTLRSASVILGYKTPQALYMRQRGPKAIPAVRVGGTIRVHEDTILELLATEDIQKRTDTQLILSLYRRIVKENKDA